MIAALDKRRRGAGASSTQAWQEWASDNANQPEDVSGVNPHQRMAWSKIENALPPPVTQEL